VGRCGREEMSITRNTEIIIIKYRKVKRMFASREIIV
jgi:hypothetical protein